MARQKKSQKLVAPFAGAWIEISGELLTSMTSQVAPFAGAWIEIQFVTEALDDWVCRSLRGSVD